MVKQALILVGGRGTRLGEAARDYPKPLVPIAGDTRFLDYLIEDIARHGIEDIILLAGHRAEQVTARYDGKQSRGARLRVVVEPAPAGTAGALRYVADDLDDVFLLTNGDSFLDMNYLALTRALGPNDMGAMALRRVPDARRFGRVEISGDRVVGYHEKDASFSGEALISAGVYVLRRTVLDLIATTPCSIETDVFPRMVENRALACAVFDGHFIDIGLPETLAEARAEFAAKMRRGAVFFDRDGTLNRDDGYTHKPEALHWLPGAVEAIRRCNDAGRLVVVVTNQAGIARGLYPVDAMHRFHAQMQADLRAAGAHVDAFYFSPYHADGVVPGLAHADHPDRKPNPGMLRRAELEWPTDKARSFMVGDNERDSGAAAAFGVPCVLVKPGEILSAVETKLSETTRASLSPTGKAATDQLKHRATMARAWLFDHALPLWWRNGFDHDAQCFHERLAQDGSPTAEPRRVRVQARQTLVFARAGRLGWSGPWREATEAGARVLLDRAMRADGGTNHLLGADGAPSDNRRDLYDLAFVTVGLAEAALSLGNRTDLTSAAEKLIAWAEANWAHPNGGFREGDITSTPPRRQNPHMHMFEALLALNDAARASRIAALMQTKLFDTEHGALPEFFNDDWTPRPGDEGALCEPGHQFEWSWLLHRYRALGGDDLSDIAERLRVHAELYGVERGSAVVYDDIFRDGRPRTKTSRLWPHTERIKANLTRFELTRDPLAADAVCDAYDMLMRYCDTPIKGLWRDRRLSDGSFVDEPAPASSFYHIMMALFELIRVTEAAD